jgi:hypothetical protein
MVLFLFSHGFLALWLLSPVIFRCCRLADVGVLALTVGRVCPALACV